MIGLKNVYLFANVIKGIGMSVIVKPRSLKTRDSENVQDSVFLTLS